MYRTEVRHPDSKKYRVIVGANQRILEEQTRAQAAVWAAEWRDKKERSKCLYWGENKKKEANIRTAEAKSAVAERERILISALEHQNRVEWDQLKCHESFDQATPEPPEKLAAPEPPETLAASDSPETLAAPEAPKTPERPLIPDFPREPQVSDPDFVIKLDFFDRIFFLRRRIEQEANRRFAAKHMRWQDECESLRRQAFAANTNYLTELHDYLARRQAWDKARADLDDARRQHYLARRQEWEKAQDARQKDYLARLQEWETARAEFECARRQADDVVDNLCARYSAGDPAAIKEYCDIVLSNSEYPDCFPREWILEFDIETGTLVVEFRLPSLADMPTIKEVKYIVSRDAFEEVRLSESFIKTLYDSVVYQVCLRTLHELFSNDKIQALKAIVFNGWVNYIDPATGQETQACIMTVQALVGQFSKINLAAVDPKVCFRSLKGVGSTQLHAMAPVQPLLKLNRTDHRFIASVDVVSRIDEGTNLAAIGWEEFEHLIRHIFEREFSHNGGEVKVTQTSRDGGVDAVAFDPDPIRGGKIVIQAKRYTNPVDVSAVRDLYGTVVNEGATKGILVTTSKFGPDAYNFAKDKPLTLMDGNNLLFLLSKHGHQAHIDLHAAKKLGVSMLRSVSNR